MRYSIDRSLAVASNRACVRLEHLRLRGFLRGIVVAEALDSQVSVVELMRVEEDLMVVAAVRVLALVSLLEIGEEK